MVRHVATMGKTCSNSTSNLKWAHGLSSNRQRVGLMGWTVLD